MPYFYISHLPPCIFYPLARPFYKQKKPAVSGPSSNMATLPLGQVEPFICENVHLFY